MAFLSCEDCKYGDLDIDDYPCDVCEDHNMHVPNESRNLQLQLMEEDCSGERCRKCKEESGEDFKKKLIHELHEINLSLRKLSGRDVTTNISDNTIPKSYKEKYFSRTAKDK